MNIGLQDSIQTEAKNVFNTKLALSKNLLGKLFSLDTFLAIIQKMLPEMMEFLPLECLNTICEASRKIRGKSPITGINERNYKCN